MRILVCGGRDYQDKQTLDIVLYNLRTMYKDITIIHGDAIGADRLADTWASVLNVPIESYPANWEKYGKAAGPIRNKQMLDTGIDLVVAFPGGKGTANMMNIAKEAQVRVIEIKPEGSTLK